ncbi:serine/threonine-protein kinase [Litoreibacter roseus]|uniref:non-specific serine/threonine protein kinase n=1 Tax=Litoreibacter roseus TaxID=2601869 RepID=A0A6N6JD99_9RHOB|nr:serine/threonine-protein kinase [Litoreibacter roseus]GFE64094.1 serine/threonine protein kinase [Litoreibacter roseus]
MAEQAVGLKPGDVIQNTYEILSLLGEGGMGATFKGRNVATGHEVAIKVMTPEFARNDKALDLFRRESSLLRTVQSDAVIRYETTLQDAQNRLFLIMEYVNGKPLAYYVKKGARLTSRDVLKLGLQLAGGLDAIHKLNIVHRDVAPDNILVPEDDILNAKLIDFGLASNTVGTEKSIIGDSVAGKFSYMAPEQLGLFGGKATAATDIYALGLVLLQVAGQAVPGAGMGAAALEIRSKDIRLKGAGLSQPLTKVLEMMLRADPTKRPSDLLGLIRQAIAAEEKSEPGRKRGPVSTPVTMPHDNKKSSRSPALFIGGALVALVIAVGGSAYLFLGSGAVPEDASLRTVDRAIEVTDQADPVAEAVALINKGGTENLEVALGALMKLGTDKETPAETRERALVEVARMYDPDTYDAARSPFPQANAAAARRLYQQAAELGSAEAQNALTRLGE